MNEPSQVLHGACHENQPTHPHTVIATVLVCAFAVDAVAEYS